MIKNIKIGTSSISWVTSLPASDRGADARKWVALVIIRSEIQTLNLEIVLFLLRKFLLLFWWPVLVKLQAVVEQVWERDTPNLKIGMQVFSESVYLIFSCFLLFLCFACLKLFFAFSSLVFEKQSFASVNSIVR